MRPHHATAVFPAVSQLPNRILLAGPKIPGILKKAGGMFGDKDNRNLRFPFRIAIGGYLFKESFR